MKIPANKKIVFTRIKGNIAGCSTFSIDTILYFSSSVFLFYSPLLFLNSRRLIPRQRKAN